MQPEEQLIAAQRGKWSEAGVPHRGWICVDIEDLGEPQMVCEMCESRRIRYVHHMQHPQFREVLAVGVRRCGKYGAGYCGSSFSRGFYAEPDGEAKALAYQKVENFSQR